MNQNCPYCGSDRIGSDLPEFESGSMIVIADCDSCKKEWKWTYSYKLEKTEILSENVDMIDHENQPN